MHKAVTCARIPPPVRVQFESDQEAELFAERFQAVAYTLGPMLELKAVLPDGRVLHKPLGGCSLAAQCASLNERLEDRLRASSQSFSR